MRVALPGDGCESDWIWDRGTETAAPAEALAGAGRAWQAQLSHLLEHSDFYRRKLASAGVGDRLRLEELDRLPFTTKDELKGAIEEAPPYGSNLAVPPAGVKRVYQTSGTTGAPTLIALTAQDIDAWTEIGSRTYYATGIHDHSGVVSTFGAGPFVAGHTNFVLVAIGARVVPVGPGDTDRVLFGLRAGIADTLLATPSFAQYLANRGDAASTNLRHVVTGGEPGGGIPEVRDHIGGSLDVTVTEIMGIGDVSPSLFGECPLQQGMHFCGAGHIWPELVDPDSRQSLAFEPGATGELAYTHLTRQAMPVVRFLGGDIVRIEGTECGCGRTSFRMRCIGRRDDMFIVRGVNVYPSAIVGVVGDFRPRVTGRARVVRGGASVAIDPPVPVEVEVADAEQAPAGLAAAIEDRIRARLTFRARVKLVSEPEFGDSGYKTRLTVTRS